MKKKKKTDSTNRLSPLPLARNNRIPKIAKNRRFHSATATICSSGGCLLQFPRNSAGLQGGAGFHSRIAEGKKELKSALVPEYDAWSFSCWPLVVLLAGWTGPAVEIMSTMSCSWLCISWIPCQRSFCFQAVYSSSVDDGTGTSWLAEIIEDASGSSFLHHLNVGLEVLLV